MASVAGRRKRIRLRRWAAEPSSWHQRQRSRVRGVPQVEGPPLQGTRTRPAHGRRGDPPCALSTPHLAG